MMIAMLLASNIQIAGEKTNNPTGLRPQKHIKESLYAIACKTM